MKPLRSALVVLLMMSLAPSFRAQAGREAGFEVCASLYPWDVHDEGIDVMLDNLIGLAGVNSVYLISVMHEEHRPFNGPPGTGPWLYIHNPARTEWNVEDSRAYFQPRPERYGRIKPYTSAYAWLRDTDWLDVVIKAARARKLKVGAEVSHTYLPREIFAAHPEYQQRDLNGKPLARPCPNHPDVREYLVALYAELAARYDLDFVQTCMYLFAGSGLKDGTCFCEACQREAASLGFDLAGAMPILRDNPNAQPQLDRWLSFRKAATTRTYKLIVEGMRKVRPGIDFRLNDQNNRPTGLALEELKTEITSVHLSTHTEQEGYEKTDRKSRIDTVRYFLGPDVPIIPGIPVRLLATPAIVRSSIKISVDNGARGIALKHYDGASFSLLRAVRDGLAAAGVRGYPPHRGVEAEDMALSGYVPGTYLTERCITTAGSGVATSTFGGASGVYDIVVSYADEKDVRGSLALFTGGAPRADWALRGDAACWRRKTVAGIALKSGDEIRIAGTADGREGARVDHVEFIERKR
jgi:hypothetical protein